MRRDTQIITSMKDRLLTHPVRNLDLLTKPEEWRELILDIIDSDSPREMLVKIRYDLQFYYMGDFLGNPRDGATPFLEAPRFFNSLLLEERHLVREAFALILREVMADPTQKNLEYLKGLLFLAGYLKGVIPGAVLLEIISLRKIPDPERLNAANALLEAGYADSVPLKYWRERDLLEDPIMVIPVLRALLKEDQIVEVLDTLNRATQKPEVHHLTFHFLFGQILERLIRTTNGFEIAAEKFKKLPDWARADMKQALEMEKLTAPHKATVMLNALVR